jgi:hypothetical protein
MAKKKAVPLPCTCKDWVRGMSWISSCESMAFVHGSNLPEDVPYFKYCPWCGFELKTEKE